MGRKATAQRTTMKDVAELAGVSQTTVSFVLNDVSTAGIPEETRERVWEAIRQLNYRPNALARGLRAQSTKTIGFVSDTVASSPFANEIIAGAQATAWQHERLLLLVNTGGSEKLKQAAIETLLERQVDGIIYATMYHRAAQPPEALYEIPSVLLDCYVEDRSLPSVVPDEVEGGRAATALLLAKGHRQIGFLCDSSPVPAAVGRLDGYRQALAAAGLPFDQSLVAYTDSDSRGGYRGARALMERADRPTALFCYNDRMAMGAYDALRQLGLAIPNDVAVVGFDNMEVIAAHLYPPLTTMRLPHYEMGQWAVNYLLQLPDRGDARLEQHRMSCPLVERESA